jgi:hypothetical protein
MLLRKGKITMHSPSWPTNARARGTRLAVLSALLACGVLLAMIQPAAAQPDPGRGDRSAPAPHHIGREGIQEGESMAALVCPRIRGPPPTVPPVRSHSAWRQL